LGLATVAGLGFVPATPGTFGTLAGPPVFWYLSRFSPAVYLFLTAALFLVGVAVSDRAERILGRPDDPRVVIDEVVGYLVTMTAMPPTAWTMLLGFMLFRVFDIAKPWPCRALDRRVHGGLGIMIDDVMAGVYAWAVLRLIMVMVPGPGL
jgi:phosphatidylglycerophosphatase A